MYFFRNKTIYFILLENLGVRNYGFLKNTQSYRSTLILCENVNKL